MIGGVAGGGQGWRVERPHLAERCRLHPALAQPLTAHGKLVLQDELEELRVREVPARCFLKPPNMPIQRRRSVFGRR